MSGRTSTFLPFRSATVCLVALLVVAWLLAGEVWSKPPSNLKSKPPAQGNVDSSQGNVGPRASKSERAASRAIVVTKVEPNARSRALAEAEAVAAGLAPEAAADRPALVDHSLSIHFPPIKGQTAGDCTCYSSTYYYNTFLQAQDEGLDATAVGATGLGNPDVICSPRFTMVIISEDGWGATGTRTAMERLADSGTANVSEFDYEEPLAWGAPWPYEAAWVEALRNRTGPLQSIRVDTTEGIEAMKQVIANGSCVVTRADFGANYVSYRDTAAGYGINNHVMYDRDMSWHGNIHSICICGYDDNKSYVDHRDGKTYYGAFIIANSEGPNKDWYNSSGTGTKGFMWVSYSMFLERQLGYYNWPWDVEPERDPCHDNETDPTVYYHPDRPHYRPRLFAVVGINHSKRNLLILDGGIGDTTTADFWGPEAIKHTDFGQVAINDSRRVAVDLTDGVDLLEPGVSTQVFARLFVVDGAGSNGTITSADFYYDPEGDGSYMVFSSTDPTVVITPNHYGYATAQITAPVAIYVDDDAAGNPVQDGTPAHPYETIQAGIDAATGPAVVHVLPGTYHESVEMDDNITLLGAGPAETLIDSAGLTNSGGLGEAVFCSGVTGGTVDGFRLTTSDTSDTALRTINSTVTVRNCVATGCANAFGVGQTGSATLANCLAYGNTRGVWQSGTSTVTVSNCTLADNSESGVVRWGSGAVTVTDSILWDNGDDVASAGISLSYCDISDGDSAGVNGNISQDPLFVTGPQHDYYLSQVAAGQGADSPCVNAGSTSASFVNLNSRTTRTDEAYDTLTLDVGYHAPYELCITSIEQASPEVQIGWNAQPGVGYVVEWSDDRQAWNDVPVGETDTWLDTDTTSYTCKYYRVREE